MTRYLLMLLLAAASIFGAPSMRADDKRGDMTLGIGGGYASANHSGYADIYFRYTFARHVRIAPEVAYVFRNDNLSAFKVDVDMQFPFAIAKGVQVYPLAGMAFNNWNVAHGDTHSRFGLNVGGGFDLKFTPQLRVTIQAKYSIMEHTDGVYVGAGIGYNF